MILQPLTVDAALADGLKPHVNARGKPFVQLYQRLPFFGRYFYSRFEVDYDTEPGVRFAREHMALPLILAAFYLAAVCLGCRGLRRASAVRRDLRYPLACWNALLCGFSFAGAVRTVPDLLYRLGSAQSPLDTISTAPAESWGVGATGFWVQLCVFSKVPELLDTFFIVARHRPLLFLHPYHHATVLLYCWHAYATEAPQALYFVAMNYSVHAIMYGYYCLVALKLKPAWLPPAVITVAQISQMVVGLSVQLGACYVYFTDRAGGGKVNGANVFWGGLMYLSYVVLFVHFAVRKYKYSGSAAEASRRRISPPERKQKAA